MKSLIIMETTTLDRASHRKKLLISSIDGDSTVCERLFEIGFSPNEEIEIQQQLLWNGPMIVSVRGSQVALRKSEARCISIQIQSR